MNTLERKILKNVRYLCGTPEIAKSRYDQLKRTFSENNLYLLFAEPIYMHETKTIIWTTPQNGSPVKYNKLTPEDQAVAKKILREKIKQIITKAKTFEDQKLVEFIFNCIEVPAMTNVFLLKQKDQNTVVLTEWGFVSDTPGSQRGLLAKIIEVQKTDITIKTVFHDNKAPAPHQKVIIKIEDSQNTYTSDEDAKIYLEQLPVDSEFTVITEFSDGNNKEYKFFVYENGNYVVETEHLIDLKFIVKDSNNNNLPGETFIFEINGQTQKHTSDNQGFIFIKKIKIQTPGIAYQQKDDGKKENVHNFVAEEGKEYILKVKKQVYKMRLKIVDDNGEPVANADVKVKFDGKTEILKTDPNGYAILTGIKPGTKVQVIAKGKKQKKQNKK